MPYSFRIYDSIRDVPAADWRTVRGTHREPFTEPKFIQLVEETLGELTQTAVVVVYDDAGRPAAGMCLNTCLLDTVMEAAPGVRRAVGWVRRLWPNFLRFKTAMSGMPTAVEQEKLCFRAGADRAEALRLFSQAAAEFARRHHASLTILGDFFSDDAAWMDELQSHGFSRGCSLPSHFLDIPQRTFDDYLLAMRSCYRTDIQHDMRLLDRSRVRIEVLDDAAKQADPITPEFYAFYLRLLERVVLQLITLPRHYFNEFIARLRDRLQVLLVYVDDQPAGFFISYDTGETYQLLTVAVDEPLSRQYGIYRNLYFHEIESAQSRGLRHISLGTTVDEFKLRIGSKPRGRIIYVKVGGWLQAPFQILAKYFMPEIPTPAAKNVFRENRISRPPRLRKAA
ncbi:MAG: GNAT family N-acetyltransferase [Planctomycetia bacterium]|nr:GNAT family N-acetyltransferase [Planctomycetia bacterium]